MLIFNAICNILFTNSKLRFSYSFLGLKKVFFCCSEAPAGDRPELRLQLDALRHVDVAVVAARAAQHAVKRVLKMLRVLRRWGRPVRAHL